MELAKNECKLSLSRHDKNKNKIRLVDEANGDVVEHPPQVGAEQENGTVPVPEVQDISNLSHGEG